MKKKYTKQVFYNNKKEIKMKNYFTEIKITNF